MRIAELIKITPWNYYAATHDFYGLLYQWTSRIISVEGNVVTKPDLHTGKIIFSPLTVTLDNTDGVFTTLYHSTEARGGELLHRLYDLDGSAAIGSMKAYVITDVKITRSECVVTATPYSPGAFDVTIPKASIQADVFGDSIDESSIGKPIGTWFGLCNNVPLYSIYEGGTGDDYVHDFLIGYGTILATTSATTITSDDGTSIRTLDISEYTVYDGSQASPYPGYAFVRFNREQRDGSGRLCTLQATFNGIYYAGDYNTANPVRILQLFLSNATWGLGLTVNATSFNNAATMFDNDDYWVAGGFNAFCKASEWIDLLLAACRFSVLLPGSGSGIEIVCPAQINTVSAYFTKYNMISPTLKKRNSDDYINTIKCNYKYDLTDDIYTSVTVATGNSFGLTEDLYSPFTVSAAAALAIATEIKNRFLYQDNILEFECGQDGYGLDVGDIVSVTYDDYGLDGNLFEVVEIEKTLDRVRIKAASYSADIFQ